MAGPKITLTTTDENGDWLDTVTVSLTQDELEQDVWVIPIEISDKIRGHLNVRFVLDEPTTESLKQPEKT